MLQREIFFNVNWNHFIDVNRTTALEIVLKSKTKYKEKERKKFMTVSSHLKIQVKNLKVQNAGLNI